MFSLYKPMLNMLPRVGPFWPQGHNLNSLYHFVIWINSMIELIDLMMQHFLLGVTLNMLFGQILTPKLIILDI